MKTGRGLLVGFAVILVAILAGCASMGPRVEIPVNMPGPEGGKATIVAHNQQVPDWMLAKDKLQLNYIVKGDVTAEQLAAVGEAECACRIYTGTVRPNNLVAVLSSGVLYGAAGFAGLGAGAQVFPGASFVTYGPYGAAANGLAGVANGIISLGGKTYTFENCGKEIFDLFPGYNVKVLQKSPY